jgi:hypothetical protein
MFLFAGVYEDLASAEGDYEVIKILHTTGDIGSYDAAVITQQRDGKIELHKTAKPSQDRPWSGLAASAAGAVAFPSLLPTLVAEGAAGAGLSAWIGHVANGTSPADAREVGELIGESRAELIVVGIDRDARKVEQTAMEASKSTLKYVDADVAEAEREAVEAMQQAG